jgi:nucleoside-diphosphate-sugar epimerase
MLPPRPSRRPGPRCCAAILTTSTPRAGAVGADGVIHLAFTNDFSDFAGAAALDLRAVRTIGSAIEGSGKPFVVTSGTLLLALLPATQGRLGTEQDAHDPLSQLPRIASENAAMAMADRGFRSSIVRLAPCVHDEERACLASSLIEIARDKGVSAFVGDGANRWPAMHRLDAARVFRLALEDAPPGARLHAVAEEGVPLRQIAEAIGRRLSLPVVNITAEESGHFGDIAPFVALNNPTSSAWTRELLDWKPEGPQLIPDLEGK